MLIQISKAPVSEMPTLADEALKGATTEQVKTMRRERKPLSYFRKSYRLKSWIDNKTGNEVVVKLKNLEAGEDADSEVAKVLAKLAKEIRQALRADQ